jgi:hypothetical protein
MIGRRLVAGTALVAAVAAGGVAGAMIGVPGTSGAATSSTSTTTKPSDANGPESGRGFHRHGPFGADKGVLDAGAKALGLSTDDLMTKLRDGKTTIADVAKAQNVDVQTVIDAMAAVAKSDIEDLVNNPLPAPPSFGFGHGGIGIGIGIRENKLDAAAKALGITSDELMTQLRDDKSIADVAKAKNVDVNTVIDAIVSDAKAKLDDAVKDGHLTQAQADELQTDLKDRVTELVNNTRPKFEHHFGPGGKGPDANGPGGPGFGGEFGPGPGTGRWDEEPQQG